MARLVGSRPLSRRERNLPIALAVVALLCLALLADGHGAFDLYVYGGAVRSWLHGGGLYDYLRPGTPYGFTYPPFAAITMLPLAVLPPYVAQGMTIAADAALITGTTWWLACRVAPRYGVTPWYATACAVPVVSLFEPVRDTVGFCQVNLMLAALVVADLEGLRRGSRWAGIGTGLAAAVKLTPAVFVVLLLAARPRAALTAVGTGLIATLGAFVVAPSTSVAFWTHALLDTSRVGRTDLPANQALSGLLARAADAATAPTVPWLLCVAGVGVLGMVRVVRAVRAGDLLAGLAICGLTGNLMSPITWTHHLYWAVPAVAVLLDAGARRRRYLGAAAAVTVLFCSSLPDLVSTPLGEPVAGGPLVFVARNSYVLATLLLVTLLPVRDQAADDAPGRPAQELAVPA